VNTSRVGQSGRASEPPEPNPLSDRVQVEQVAALLADRRKRQSLRVLAKEIGISKSAVDGLVQAYHQVRELPQPHANWHKLKEWYLSQKRAEAGGLSDPVGMAMLALEMVAGVPEAERQKALRKLVASLVEIYDSAHAPRPAWLARLADAVEDDS
jgi:hypothetical protein